MMNHAKSIHRATCGCAMPDLGRADTPAPTDLLQSSSGVSAAGDATNALPGGRSGMAHARRTNFLTTRDAPFVTRDANKDQPS